MSLLLSDADMIILTVWFCISFVDLCEYTGHSQSMPMKVLCARLCNLV